MKIEPCLIRFESNAYLAGRNKQTASKGRERALAPILGGARFHPSSKDVLCVDPGAAEGGLVGRWEMKGLVEAL